MSEAMSRAAMPFRFPILAGLAFVCFAGAASAADLRMTVQKPHFTCEGRTPGFDRVSYRPGGAPLPCCDGQLGCAQFLSTTTIVRTPHQWHG